MIRPPTECCRVLVRRRTGRRSPRQVKPLASLLILSLTIVVSLSGQASADEKKAGDRGLGGVTIGIDGHYRVGRWTAIRSERDSTIDSIETRDGDGVQVRYHQSDWAGAWNYAIPGSEAAPLIARSADQVIATTRFPTAGSPARGPAMIPLKMPWIVAFGDPLGVETIGANEILKQDASIAVSQPNDASRVPDSALAYDGVDLVMIGGSAIELLRELDQSQQQALVQWVRTGGRLFLTLGESAPQLIDAAPWLLSLLPMDEIKLVTATPSAVETFTSTQTPLQNFPAALLPPSQGRVLIRGRDIRRQSIALAARYSVGFGRITVIAADLEKEPFVDWPNRLDLITRLTGSLLIPDTEPTQRKTRATAYNDLAGQLRATLDQFSLKRRYQFSFVSLLLMLLIAALGPLDFLLVNRLLGRPLLGWLSFPIVVIGLSVLLVMQSRPVSLPAAESQSMGELSTSIDPGSTAVQNNRIEVIDVDLVEGIGRGFAASYLYSHDAALFDVDVKPASPLKTIATDSPQILNRPFGYPGEAFGGIQIAIEDARLPIYEIKLRREADPSTLFDSRIHRLPLAARSSKGIGTEVRFKPDLPTITVEHRPGSELLQGELFNPLPLDILDGILIYRNWAYLLPTRFPAGGRIGSLDVLRQKNFRWQLSRQRALESASESEEWDPGNTQSLSRIGEMLMFHRAVGAERYTGLQNEPLADIDLTHALAGDRCILVGRVEQPLTEMQIQDATADQARGFAPAGRSLNLIRVIIPVVDR